MTEKNAEVDNSKTKRSQHITITESSDKINICVNKIGVGSGHADVLRAHAENLMVTDDPPEELVPVECPNNCGFTAVIDRDTISMSNCPGCGGELKVDPQKWAHRCPDTAADLVVESRGQKCPYCGKRGSK